MMMIESADCGTIGTGSGIGKWEQLINGWLEWLAPRARNAWNVYLLVSTYISLNFEDVFIFPWTVIHKRDESKRLPCIDV